MTTHPTSHARRGVLARLGATAAAAGAAGLLPRAVAAAPVAVHAPAPRDLPSGYRETERMRAYYRLARY